MFPDINSNWNNHVPMALLQKAIMFSSHGYVITDCGQKNKPVIFVNKAFQEITGYEAKDVLGKNCCLLLERDTKQDPLKKLQDAIKHGRRCTVVLRNYKKDGSLFYNELTFIASITSQHGKEAHRIWGLRDVSEFVEIKERTELQLIEKDERFSAYMKNSNEAIWRIDFDPPIPIGTDESRQVQGVFDSGIFTEVNDVAARIYGYAKGEYVCGRPLRVFMERSSPKNIAQITDLVRKKFQVHNLVTFEKGSNNTTIVILNNITPTIYGDKVLYIWGASLDISELFKTKEILRTSEEKLASQAMELEEKNIALKVLIGQIELEKRDLKDRVMANLENVLLPSLEKIRSNKWDETYIEQFRMALENLTSSFGQQINKEKAKLSPREMEICSFIRNGMANKEIAGMLNIALHTVEKHRRTVRRKLGITNKGINLYAYLNSL